MGTPNLARVVEPWAALVASAMRGAARGGIVGFVLAGVLAACATGADTSISAVATTVVSPFPTDTIIYTPDPSLPKVTIPSSGETDAPSGAVAISLGADDLAAIGDAFAQWTGFSQWGCPVQPASPLYAAVISATGVEWAFGRLEPRPGCVATQNGQRFDPITAYPFGTGSAGSSGVFEKDPNGSWAMNYFESYPFPCPDDPGSPVGAPGPGTQYVPRAVLNAVRVPYASGCEHVYVPPAPR